MKQRLLLFLLMIIALSACTRGIAVDNVWGRPSPAGAANGAFYIELANDTGEDDALVAVRSDVCGTVELHESQLDDNGVMRMGPVAGDRIELPAGETVTLQPGGLHVMCIGLTRPLVAGESIPLTLVFADAAEIGVEAEIREAAP
jgi:copper(I)-binding protein